MIPKLSYNNKQEYCVLDKETESLNLFLARPWQIAFSLCKGNKVIQSFERYPLFEDLNVSKGAARVTGFSYEKYRDLAVPAIEVAEELSSIVEDPKYLIVAHNGLGFDFFIYRTLMKSMNLWKGWGFINRAIDTLPLSRCYNAEEKFDTSNFLASQMKFLGRPKKGSKKANLGAMCKSLDIELDPSRQHDAVYDVEKTFELFDKLKYKLEI